MSSLSQPQPQPKHLQRKLPDVITAVSENETKSSEDIVNHIGEKAKGEEAAKKSEAVREETENKSEVFLYKSDIKGERSCVISGGGVRSQHETILNNNKQNHPPQFKHKQIEFNIPAPVIKSNHKQHKILLPQTVPPALPPPKQFIQDQHQPPNQTVISRATNNHLHSCSINIILNTIAANGLDKV